MSQNVTLQELLAAMPRQEAIKTLLTSEQNRGFMQTAMDELRESDRPYIDFVLKYIIRSEMHKFITADGMNYAELDRFLIDTYLTPEKESA